MVKWIKACIVIALIAEVACATVRRVPSEYDTIQAAIDDCEEGDTVLVSPGVYSVNDEFSGVVVRIGMNDRSITLKSEQGPSTCIIDSQGGSHSLLRYGVLIDGPGSILDGFKIINGNGSGSLPGAIWCGPADIEIRNCIITGNTSRSRAAGILVSGRDSNVTITNCLITGNQCLDDKSFGGGVYCTGSRFGSGDDSRVILRNCVIAGNQAAYGGGVACGPHATIRLENCIVTNNRAMTGQGEQVYLYDEGIGATRSGGELDDLGIIELVHSCFDQEIPVIYFDSGWGCSVCSGWAVDFYGLGSIATDPGLAIPGHWDTNGTSNDPNDDVWIDGDYHLKSQAGRWDPTTKSWVQDDITSPCIDAGHSNIPIGNEPFPNGGITNIGAYGGTVEASKSYFGAEPCDTIMAGDINGDCNVDFTDIELLLSHWLWSGEPYEPEPIPREVYNPPNDNEPNEPGDPRR